MFRILDPRPSIWRNVHLWFVLVGLWLGEDDRWTARLSAQTSVRHPTRHTSHLLACRRQTHSSGNLFDLERVYQNQVPLLKQSFKLQKPRHNDLEQSVNPTELQEITQCNITKNYRYRTRRKQQKYSHVQYTNQELHHVNQSWSWMYNTLEYQLRDGLSEACQQQSDLISWY